MAALLGSIIIPVLNEAPRITQLLQDLRAQLGSRWQLIVVDGGSQDDTVALARDHCDCLVSSAPGRSLQMNAGAKVASTALLVFLHADTGLPTQFEAELTHFLGSNHTWGRFDVQLDGSQSVYRLIAWMMNQRSRLTGIATGDQTFFVKREFFDQLHGFPEMPLMEDVEFSRRAVRLQRPYCSRIRVITSSRKWQKNGILRTIVLMWWIRLAYFLGVSPVTLHRWYYPSR